MLAQTNDVVSAPSLMTIQNTMTKVAITFGILLAAFAIGWTNPILALPAGIVSIVLGIYLSYTYVKKPVASLILIFAALEGVFVGGLSSIYEARSEGIVYQAVIGTLVVLSVLVGTYGTPLMTRIRRSSRIARTVAVSMIGYAAFCLLNFSLMITGIVTDPWGLRTALTIPGTDIPLGVVLGIVAIVLASYCFTKDLEWAEAAISHGTAAKYGWSIAFALMVSVVWMYVELLRLLAILRR